MTSAFRWLRSIRVGRRLVRADGSACRRIADDCRNQRPTVLMVLHTAGGGTEKHVGDLVDICRETVNVLLIRARAGVISLVHPDLAASVDFAVATQWDLLLEFLRDCNVARVHVHHFFGHEEHIRRLVAELDRPFDFTAHDYYVLSPQPHLVGGDGRFVGEDLAASAAALVQAGMAPVRPRSLQEWQSRYGWLATEASRFIVASEDALRRFQANLGRLRAVVAAHPRGGAGIHSVKTEFRSGAPLRIAVVGEIYPHKGVGILSACAKLALVQGLPLQFVILGLPHPDWDRDLWELGVKISGRYDVADLSRLAAGYAPHLLWYPALCPETFSYTLSEGLQLGLPLAVTDLGALPERVGGRSWTWVRPWDMDAQAWISFFMDIRERHFVTGTPPEPVGVPWAITDQFYRNDYFSWSKIEKDRKPGSD